MYLTTLTNNRLLHSEPGASTIAAPSAPAAPAVEPSAPAPASAPPAEDVDFVALSKEYESDLTEDVAVGEPEPAPVPTAPASPQPPAAQQPAIPPTEPSSAPSVPVVEPVVPTPAAASPQPATPPAAPPVLPAAAEEPITPEKIEAAYKQYETNILPQLEQRYALTPEQAEQLAENPAQVIPKLMARVHYEAQVAAYTGIISQMPRIVGSVVERYTAVKEAEGRFHNRWPMLKDQKYAQSVDAGLRTFRAANPKATTEDMIEKAGLMLMLSLGLNPTPQQEPSAPIVPQTPARPAGTAGAGQARIPGSGASNIFEEMADDITRGEL